MASTEQWEFRFKACSAGAAVVTALSIIVGGFVGLYTFRQQGLAAEALKVKELRLTEYNQKRDVYYELVNAAASVAASETKDQAQKYAIRYSTLYFGKAHIFAIDREVNDAKIRFRVAMGAALAKGAFPSSELQSASLELAAACKKVLRAEDVFGVDRPPAQSEESRRSE